MGRLQAVRWFVQKDARTSILQLVMVEARQEHLAVLGQDTLETLHITSAKIHVTCWNLKGGHPKIRVKCITTGLLAKRGGNKCINTV